MTLQEIWATRTATTHIAALPSGTYVSLAHDTPERAAEEAGLTPEESTSDQWTEQEQ